MTYFCVFVQRSSPAGMAKENGAMSVKLSDTELSCYYLDICTCVYSAKFLVGQWQSAFGVLSDY